MHDLISVIIPFYNHKAYVQQAYQNVCKQTYVNWELVFVNNNSSDGSLDEAESISESDKRVSVITEAKQGIAPARNAGLRAAKGEFVTFLDIDDKFINDKFINLLEVFKNNPEIGMAYGLTRRIYLPENRVVIQEKGIVKEGLNNEGTLAKDWISSFYKLPQTGSTLIRTLLAKEVGGFDEDLELGNDDVGFHLKLAFKSKIGFINKEVVVYYRHVTSAGAQLNDKVSVHMRYLDAYCRLAIPLAMEYKQISGNNSALKQAQKNATGDLMRVVYASDDREAKKLELLKLYNINFPFLYTFMIHNSDRISEKRMTLIKKIILRFF